MTKALRIFTLMMAAALLFTSLGVNVSAINIYGVTDNSHRASYGGKSLPLSEYDPNGKTVAYTKDGKLCPEAHPGSSCSNCKVFTYTYHVNGKKYTGSAKQCYGFAFYVQQQLFGVFYQSAKEDNANKFDVIRSFATIMINNLSTHHQCEFFTIKINIRFFRNLECVVSSERLNI